jgi:hypothetical protein
MNRVAEFQWQDAVQDAVHERDPAKLEAKIKTAEIAIFRRIHTFRPLQGNAREPRPEPRLAIEIPQLYSSN